MPPAAVPLPKEIPVPEDEPQFGIRTILLGAPGSGKGTQAARLMKKFCVCHLSTGDMLRAEISSGSKLGQDLKKVMDEDKPKEFKHLWQNLNLTSTILITFQFTGEPLIRRSDDNVNALKKRLDSYNKQTKPLVHYYTAQGVHHRIDASKHADEVFDTLVKKFTAIKMKDKVMFI
ncbi:hypothetical protein J437_LFUL003006 [Ladona fulva]|uniref:Nucleoside-diphosphate kinase n=1 Tax=Ladona fulva TaxID=123851 RepID=A0A8K0JTZ5_LADFU|nr:hypothetical protein J437_LFUL003006 [Ladona fulva]